MSAPLRPAAWTRTSSSPAFGEGSGWSWTAISPSRMVAARSRARCYSRRRQDSPICRCAAGPRDGVMRVNGRAPPPYSVRSRAVRAAAVARVARRPGGCAAAAEPDLARRGRGAGRGPAGAPGARLHGRRRHARDDDQVAAGPRLPHAACRHPSQRRMLGGGLRAPRGASGGARRPHRSAGRDHRPEPRRRARPGGRGAAPRPRVRDRDAGRAVGVDAPDPSARPAAGRRARRARHRPRSGPVLHELPARAVLQGRSGRTSRPRSRPMSATPRSTRARTGSSTGARAWTRARTSSSRSARRTAAWRSTRARTGRSPVRWPHSRAVRRRRSPAPRN